MATSYAAPPPPSATEVGSFFVSQYYPVLQQQPEAAHQFYTDASSIVRVDGDSTESASALMQIHSLIMARIYTNVHIKTIHSVESWSGGVHLVVSGFVKSTDFTGWRRFVQSFFLAPQEKGYFVLNDIFHLIGDEAPDQSPELIQSQDALGSQPTFSEPVQEQPAPSDYALEEEAREYVDSVHIEGDVPVEEYKFQEHQQVEEYKFQEHQQESEPEPEAEEEESHLEEPSSLHQSVAETEQEPPLTPEEPAGEPQKFTYASILRVAKGKPAPLISTRPPSTKSTPPAPEFQSAAFPPVQQSNLAGPVVQNSFSDVGEEGSLHEPADSFSGETKSIYVRNLPLTATTLDVLQEFKNFGKIKKDGVFLKNRKDIGICYAFVEFEDAQSVEHAVKASPVLVGGRQVYVEERRANNSTAPRGGRGGRGRGRGRFGGRGFGENNRLGSNGFRGE